MMNTVRWNIAVSPDTDQSVRMFLAHRKAAVAKDDLSRFIEKGGAHLYLRACRRGGQGKLTLTWARPI